MSLSEVNRNNKELFYRIERKVLGNLAMNYEFETLADILFAYSKMNQGSYVFYLIFRFFILKCKRCYI